MAEVIIPQLRNNVYHVIIAHGIEVKERVQQKFSDSLREEGFKIYEKKGTDEVGDAIRHSRSTILVITKDYMETEEFKSVVNEAINWSYKIDRRVLLPILDDVNEKEVPRQLRVMHTSFYQMEDVNLPRRLKQGIADEVPLTTVMPAGNMAYGLAWSYFYGYLNHLLPGLKQRAKSSRFWSSKFLPKFVIIIPKDCFCPGSLTETDERFLFEGHIKCKAKRGGNERDYKSTVYSITNPNDGKYFMACEFPAPLLTLYEMANMGGQEEQSIGHLTEEQQRHQKELFVEVLQEILEHPENPECNGKCVIMEYSRPFVATEENRTDQDFVDFVLERIKEELKEIREDRPLDDPHSLYTYKVPIGDVAYGLAHTYFIGYLKLVLPDLQKEVKGSPIYQTNRDMFCTKLLLVITPDGFCPESFTDAEETFRKEKEKITFKRTRAGNKERSFDIPVFSVTAGQEKYFCMCEIPPPLQRLYDMEQGCIAGLDEEDKRKQIKLFQTTLAQILEENKEYRGKYAIISYEYSLKTSSESRDVPLSQPVIDHVKRDLDLAALLRGDSQSETE